MDPAPTILQQLATAATLRLNLSELRVLLDIHHAWVAAVSSVAVRLDLTCGNTSQIIDRLVERRLVTRAHGEDDRRVVLTSLTKSGRRAVDQILAGKPEPAAKA